MHLSILTEVQNGRIICKKKNKKKKNGRILTRNVLLKINFQDEGHLDTSFWIYILAIENFFSLNSFSLSRDIHMHNAILTGVQNGRISSQKNSHILLENVLFEAYFPR